jgi:hypothetical protein
MNLEDVLKKNAKKFSTNSDYLSLHSLSREYGTRISDFPLYNVKRGDKMSGYNTYYMGLLEGRAKRLTELIEIAAPPDMIWKEVMLITEAAKPFAPKSTPQWGYGGGAWGQKEGQSNEEFQSKFQSQCATG